MECAVKHSENASNPEREAMVSKLYNMQWLKKTSQSPTCEKTIVCKQVQDDNKNDMAKDKTLSTENVTSLVEESVAYCSTDTCKKHLSSDTVPENNMDMLIKDTANLFQSINKLVMEKDKEEEIMEVSVVESIVTAQVEAQFDADKKQKDQSSVSQSNAENITRTDDNSNLPNSQKIDQDIKKPNLTKISDDNNNSTSHSTSATPVVTKVNDKEKSTCIITDTETCKASTEIKDKDAHVKKTINDEPKINFKNGCNTRMDISTNNEKSPTFNSDSKKPIPNSLKSSRFSDKNKQFDRFNNKTGFTKNIAYIKRQEFVKQHNVSKNGMDKETKDVKSSVAKTDLKAESNKTPETCNSKNTNKDKILQKQQNGSKQFVSKLKKEEPFRRSTCLLNQSIDKNKQPEKVTNASKNSDVLNKSEKKSGKTVDEKNFEDDQKMDCGVKRSTTFVMQYKNSTFSKPVQTKNVPKNTEQPLTDGKNSSYTRNNPRFYRKRTDNAEHKAITKKEYTSTNQYSKSNMKDKKMCANNLENDSKWHEDVNRTQSSNVKSPTKIDTLTSNDKNTISMKSETYLIGDKKDVNSSVELNTCAEPETMEQCRKEAKEMNTIDKSKVDIDEQLADNNKMDNDKINPPKYSNLHFDKNIVELQPNMLYQHIVKPESIQCMDNANKLESNQTVWYNNSFDNSLYKNAVVMNSMMPQQSIQNIPPFNVQQTQVTQAGNQMRQMSQWKPDHSNKFYDQHCSTSDMMHFLQIPNTLDAASSCGRKYECNVQTPPSCESALLETTMNGENPNLLYKCAPTVQPRSVAAHSHFPNHPASSDQIGPCRWNPSIQDGFYTEHPYNTTQLATMNVYNPEVFSPDDFDNSHMTNCAQSVVYASPSCMQTWNPQLQYSMSGYFYNSPCANYAILPNVPSQPNNFTDVCSMHEQQHKYVPYVQMNEYARSTRGDPNNCARQTRSFDNVPLKSNQYYKNKNPDNCRTVYNVPQYITRSRQQSMNFATDVNQSNPYYSSNQKYHKQNPMQMSRNVKSQTIKISSSQDLVCDDNGPEVVPPIISPKEFITSKANYSNKIDQSAMHTFKPEFKARPHTNYYPSKLQKYNGGFQRNTTYQGFSKEYTPSFNIGRGTHKFKKT
ncbi:uncharacterized protein MAL13P1.304-like isoform X2 [Linepithema humile]|nr:PREDICTED: serine/threonine-protein kinase pakD-like [Linepithema humile]XP_012230209.1 PREDICTED: serine/threonine-protein kinase pakD-like [Linepithema humile]XP_012230210.1 PREDICTED: serine/threonine-protein kinase pakD-like [Linepithema humile]XP_012230211.1 PREDICTED: serine/threonine-protein kinase pakD-like [Linepithema humile]